MIAPKFIASRAFSTGVLASLAFFLSACGHVSPMVGIQIPIFKHGGINVGVGPGGIAVGAGVHAGPVSVGVNSSGAVTAGVGVNVGGVGVNVGGATQIAKPLASGNDAVTSTHPAAAH